MILKLFQSLILSAALLFAASPMVSTSMSTDNGGTKLAIDAYSDGGGVLIINQSADTQIDNSPMNKLVFKYGEGAKYSNTTLKNQVTVLETSATSLEKANALKLELAKAVINPPVNGVTCDDGNLNTHSDTYSGGICVGVPTTLNIVDFFGDGSGRALYQFENNAVDTGNAYNGTATNITYATGNFGQSPLFNGLNGVSNVIPFAIGNSISMWVRPTTLNNFHTLMSTNNNALGLVLDVSGRLAFQYLNTNGSNVTTVNPIPLNNWSHIIFNLTSSNTAQFYINGVPQSLGASIYNYNQQGTIPSLGFRGTYLNAGVIGSMDQVRIFNRVITATEATRLFNEQ